MSQINTKSFDNAFELCFFSGSKRPDIDYGLKRKGEFISLLKTVAMELSPDV